MRLISGATKPAAGYLFIRLSEVPMSVLPLSTILAGPTAGRLPPLQVVLAAPRGFCAGVVRAIDAVIDAIAHYGAPVYVRHAIVHNRAVIRDLERRGAIFVEELSDIPEGEVAILSAHGAPRRVWREGRDRALTLVDATCPLVAKVHREVIRHQREGRHIVLIGHADHPEIIGTLGQIPPGGATVVCSLAQITDLPQSPDHRMAYAIQTTYSVEDASLLVEALRARFSDLAEPRSNDICYATTARQAAVRHLAGTVDAMLIVGEDFSSNACRLADTARGAGCASVQLVATCDAICFQSLEGCAIVGVSAAASTPANSVDQVLSALAGRFRLSISEMDAEAESMTFKRVAVV
ncbi:MAG: 4-hydroxy-3-methylbut-2-enyl diphosphate reductase, partial [Micrococcales bacterium]|nr:4-hydroxy-3-methylbut-2-enyl diphosphate reductase [Micrococcales bacterium]